MRALIVDDSRATRSLLRRTLTEVGYEVLEAGNGLEALELLGTCDPVDLALVDWNMPEMDGLELVKAMRADRTYADMVVMMVSAESDMSNVARALIVGADEYAIKPVTKDILVEKLHLLGVAT
jgi:two-component system chemotaxis response regulator CheY